MNSIIKQKQRILALLENDNVKFDNVQSIHLIGSYFWGYAKDEESDIDLLIVDKEYVDTNEIEIEELKISAIRTHVKGLKNNMKDGNFWKFLISQKNFYPIYGKPLMIPFESSNEQVKDYFKGKLERDVEPINNQPIKSGFHTVMKLIQYRNHLLNIGSYKLTDFQLSEDLNSNEKSLLEKAYLHVFERTDSDQNLKLEIKAIAKKLFDLI